MSKERWSRPAPAPEGQGAKSVVLEPLPAEEVAAESSKLLEDQGWCTWRCERLGGDVIVVVIDELITGYPAGFPVYTLQELKDILQLDDPMLQMAHEAKKKLRARVEIPVACP
jgi:hypothetical protein